MSDFQISVDLDTAGILQGFRQIESQAQASGQKAGLGIQDGLNRFGKRSIAALSEELARLQSRQVRLNVDSSAFAKTGAKIRELEGLIQQVNRRQLAVNTDPRSLVVMRQRVADLNNELERVKVGSPAFKALQRDVAAASRELERAQRASEGFGGFLKGQLIGTLGALSGALSVGAFVQFARDVGATGVAAEATNIRLKALTERYGETSAAQRAVTEDAKLLGQSQQETADAFARLYGVLRPQGIGLADIRDLYVGTTAAARNLGLSTESVSNAMIQLTQGLASGRLQGDELRSVLEQLPPLSQAIASVLKRPVSDLRKLGEEGKITTEVILTAVRELKNTELSGLSNSLDTSQQKLKELGIAYDNLKITLSTAFGPATINAVKALTAALAGLDGFLRSGSVAARSLLVAWAGLTAIPLGVGAATKAMEAANSAMDNLKASTDEYGNAVEDAGKKEDAAAAARKKAIEDAKKAKIQSIDLSIKEVGLAEQLAAAQANASAQTRSLAISQRDAVASYAAAVQGVEQSRFDIAKAFNQFELSKLQERGASEAQLRAKRKEGEAIELAALQTRIANTRTMQGIELQTLNIKQQAARLEAGQALQTAALEAKKAQFELDKAMLGNDVQAQQIAQKTLEIRNLEVGSALGRLAALGQLQPLELQTLKATQQTALNQQAAEAAAKGYGVAVDGTLVKIKGIAGSFEGLSTATGLAADQQRRLADLAQATGLQTRIAADGSVEIGQAIKGSTGGANALAGSFTKVGNAAPAAAQGARDFAGFLSKGQNFAKGIAGVGIDVVVGSAAQKAGGLAQQMNAAATAADRFYGSLLQASGLPGAYFTGGPVGAGERIRINDGPGGRSLGQESFLSSSGSLSLINRPANSLWVTPSSGMVIPAAVTDSLKAAGAFGPTKTLAGVTTRVTGSDPATAALAVEVSRLRAEVGELNRKRWDVNVQLRQDGSGLRMQRMLNSMS